MSGSVLDVEDLVLGNRTYKVILLMQLILVGYANKN